MGKCVWNMRRVWGKMRRKMWKGKLGKKEEESRRICIGKEENREKMCWKKRPIEEMKRRNK
jgi:hypothetical protein